MIGRFTGPWALLIIFLLFATGLKAQPQLPDLLGGTQNGMNVLTWICQYEGIKSIAVQRSADSVRNFSTIGYVKELSKGPQAFIDGHPLAGNNWYRLYIVFGSDLTWYSNYLKLEVDSQQLLQQKVLPPNDSLQKFAAGVKTVESNASSGKPVAGTARGRSSHIKVTLDTARSVKAPKEVQTPSIRIPDVTTDADPATYIKSQYVFTNPFTGHVNVEISEVNKHVYSIHFLNKENVPIMEVPRIHEPQVIIDKRNFPKKGIYRFDLFMDNKKLETGYITIY